MFVTWLQMLLVSDITIYMYSCLSGGRLCSLWSKLLQRDAISVYQLFCYFFVIYPSCSTELKGVLVRRLKLSSRLAEESCNSLKAPFRILWKSHDDFSEPILKVPWIKCKLHDPMSMSDESLFFWRPFCTSESDFKLVFGPSIEIWITFVFSNSFGQLWNAATRSSHWVWPRNKDVQST